MVCSQLVILKMFQKFPMFPTIQTQHRNDSRQRTKDLWVRFTASDRFDAVFFRVTLHINSVKFCGVFLRLLLIVSISTSLEMLFSSLSETHPLILPSEICISGEVQITKVKFLLDAYRKTLNTSISPHKHTHTHHTTKEPRPHPSNFVEGFTKLLFFPVPLPTNTNNPITSRGKCFFSVMEPRPDSRNNSTSFRHFS